MELIFKYVEHTPALRKNARSKVNIVKASIYKWFEMVWNVHQTAFWPFVKIGRLEKLKSNIHKVLWLSN